MHMLNENLADKVELAQWADLATSEHIDITLADSTHVACRAPIPS